MNCLTNVQDEFGPGFNRRPLQVGALIIVALCGILLRLWAPGTMAFAEDQARACALAQDVAEGYWQNAGLINSGGFRNPPGFIYLLAGVWRLWPSPLALIIFVQWINVAALVVASWWMLKVAGRWEGLWAVALLASAPWAIQYSHWIWAQHLLFPAALAVYLGLWAWFVHDRPWGAFVVPVAGAVLIQIHLAGLVLIPAILLLWILWRPRIPWLATVIGCAIALLIFVSYLLADQVDAPNSARVGLRHFWRVIPGAAMSVSGLGWQTEFLTGWPMFRDWLGWRYWIYMGATVLPPILLLVGLIETLFRSSWRQRTGVNLAAWLVILIPISFNLLILRTSPTYLPVWYPLPFILIGVAMGRWSRNSRLAALCGLCVCAAQLAFFTERLIYIQHHGGVPHSLLDRSYAGLRQDTHDLAGRVRARNIWVQYAGESGAMDEATAYAFRRQAWSATTQETVLIRYRPPWAGTTELIVIDDPLKISPEAFQVLPWDGPQQNGGRILRAPLK